MFKRWLKYMLKTFIVVVCLSLLFVSVGEKFFDHYDWYLKLEDVTTFIKQWIAPLVVLIGLYIFTFGVPSIFKNDIE